MKKSRRFNPAPLDRGALDFLRELADQAFARAAGAPLVAGNRMRVLCDARENYPAWLAAIAAAERSIHFECYIIHNDAAGRQFAEALAAKARSGVRVRLIYDWEGALGAASFRFWKPLRRAGVEVRCFNPPRLDSPFGWLSRDHRKMLVVDGRIAFVTGMCVGQAWVGDAARRREPWRDTGVEIAGPAVADIEQAFARMWASVGAPLPVDDTIAREAIARAGEVALRIVATIPNSAGVYRLDQLLAAIARRSIWLTDAYFVGTTTYVEGLKAAARDGVDVRLLVPHASDIPGVRMVSRAGFRGLLEAGVRIFEWTGPMLHAKTAVVDGRWSRIGSSNLNIASWIGNWELDVIAEDEVIALDMESMYADDLGRAVEIVLQSRRRVGVTTDSALPQGKRPGAGRSGAAAGVLRIGNAVGGAITNHRALGPAEATMLVVVAGLLAILAAAALLWPMAIAAPLAVLGAWTAAALLIRAWRTWRVRD